MAITENTSKLADRRFIVYGESNHETKKTVAIKPKWTESDNGEVAFAFQGKDLEGKSGTIKLEYLDMMKFLHTLQDVARFPSKWTDKRATFRTLGYNPTTRKGDLELFLYVGRNKDGIVYIGMKVPTAMNNAIKAEFKAKFGLTQIDSEGNVLNDEQVSSGIAMTWANTIIRIVEEAFDRTYRFRGADYYQNKRGGNNNNGNNNYNNNNNGYNNGNNNNGGGNNNNSNGYSGGNDSFEDIDF